MTITPAPSNSTDDPQVVPASVLERAKRIQRELPRLEWDWCLRLAQLQVEIPPAGLADPLALAASDCRAEQRRAHRRTLHRGVITGWDRQ